VVGLFSLEPESSPELLLLLFGAESDLLETGFDPFRPEKDPEEPELLLTDGPPRVLNGETGEPRSSSLKSGLFASKFTVSRNRSEKDSNSGSGFSESGFSGECDIFVVVNGLLKDSIFC
jgi:hypothetical protein